MIPLIKPVEILLIEDNPGDIRLAREALKESKVNNIMNSVVDGVDGLDYLFKRGKYSESKRPDLIILDINLPRKSGFEVLDEIKTDVNLRTIPVVILTTSKQEEDIVRTYHLHANCFITKPMDINQFIKVIQSIQDFWFTIVKLPML